MLLNTPVLFGIKSNHVISLLTIDNKYLRYYILKATARVIRYNVGYLDYYHKKYNESLAHKHKRSLVLTERKLVILIFALLHNNQLYIFNNVVEKATI